jgi:hypothetical protein
LSALLSFGFWILCGDGCGRTPGSPSSDPFVFIVVMAFVFSLGYPLSILRFIVFVSFVSFVSFDSSALSCDSSFAFISFTSSFSRSRRRRYSSCGLGPLLFRSSCLGFVLLSFDVLLSFVFRLLVVSLLALCLVSVSWSLFVLDCVMICVLEVAFTVLDVVRYSDIDEVTRLLQNPAVVQNLARNKQMASFQSK